MLPARKKSKGKSKKDKDEEAELEQLRKELASEKQAKEEVKWVANELEKQWVSFNHVEPSVECTFHELTIQLKKLARHFFTLHKLGQVRFE